MSRLEELPADQKAVLQLLLKQGKSYDDLAGLLRLERGAVRERALDALDAIGPDAPEGLSSARQDEVADYLLGQQSAAEQSATRDFLASSAPGRAWARVVASELKPLSAGGLPDVPAEREATTTVSTKKERGASRPARSVAAGKAGGDPNATASRFGGFLLIGAVAIALAFAIIFLARDDEDDASSASSGTTATTGTGTTAAAQDFLAQINLEDPKGGTKRVGAGFVVAGEGGKPGIQVAAQGLTKSNRYAVWLSTPGGKSTRLGFARFVEPDRIIGVKPDLPSDWKSYRQLLVTLEKVNAPKTPGSIVLRGTVAQS